VWSVHVAITDKFYEIQGTNAILAPLLAGCLVSVAIISLIAILYTSFRAQQFKDFKEAQHDRLQAAQKAHEVLVSFIVHEQRNPLHLCSGSLGMLREAVGATKKATENAIRIISEAANQ